MRRRHIAQALLLFNGVLVALPAGADWQFSGSNTLRVDSYHASGDKRYSPYAQTGTFISNDLDLSLFGSHTPGQTWRFDVGGTITDSPYRSQHSGFVPEVLRMSYDNSTAALPFRLDLGDQNVQFSELTLNRTLKAGRLTLRPNSGIDGRSYWASAVVGSDGQQWRDFDPSADLYRGFSLGMQDQRLGSYGVNLVQHSREAEGALAGFDQWTASFTAQRHFDMAGQDLNLRSELAYFHGESWATRQLPEAERSRHGIGYYTQLDGKSQTRPLDYRLRYDRYSSDFRPSGSDAPADSDAMLAEGGWRLKQDMQVRGRVQRSRSSLSSSDPITTDSAGLNFSGSLLAKRPQRLIGQLNLSVQTRESESHHVDFLAKTAEGSLTFNHSPRHQTRLSGSVATVDDLNHPGVERVTRQFSAGHTAQLQLGDVALTVTPGLSMTEIDTEDDEFSMGPTLAISAARDQERVVLELGQTALRADDPDDDVEHKRIKFKYEVQRGRHSFGLDFDHTLREPAVGEDTDAWHAGMYWRYDLGKDLTGAG